ncbi:hypothetical protein Cgig2_006571 [Carnegiea gigantea]|uniref:Peptidase A2 domain-containing protein n=1 Tax=Carnegiea gigantea TaxID=171969 RepID=A0A9Q1GVX9_9CARY|nr:hypothetical protein Cgig2_006571 [Carnegiea gigantea]
MPGSLDGGGSTERLIQNGSLCPASLGACIDVKTTSGASPMTSTLKPGDAECSTEIVATIVGSRVIVPTMVFGGEQRPHFTSLRNGPLVVEMKVASAIIQRIFIDIGSSVDIITWDCLKKLTYPGGDIIPLVYPISGFGGQEVNPTGVIRLPLRFGDKIRVKNLEVDFLVVDVPMAYNIILI